MTRLYEWGIGLAVSALVVGGGAWMPYSKGMADGRIAVQIL